MMFERRKVLIISALVGLIVALFLVIFFSAKSNKTISTGVNFYISPTTAIIDVNGKKINKDKFYNLELPPGDYDIKVYATNFSDKTQKVNVKNGEVTSVYIKLDPSNNAGELLLKDRDEAKIREEVSTNLYYLSSSAQNDQNPIMKYLPAVTADWRVDYGNSVSKPDDPSAITVYVTTYSDQDRQLALNWIKSKGVDPASLDIVYRYFEGSSDQQD